jgi:hypothetical protein
MIALRVRLKNKIKAKIRKWMTLAKAYKDDKGTRNKDLSAGAAR